MPETKITFDAADDYELFMGRWSRAVGGKFLAWFDPPKSARWLDAGCGTAAFTDLILRRCEPASVTGMDPAPAQIDYAKKFLPRVTFQVGDAMDMPFGDEEFDVVASALVFHFIPDRARAFAEMKRVLRPGGLVGGYTWERTATIESAPYAPMLRGLQSIGAEVLSSPTVPEGHPAGLHASLENAGFTDIATTIVEVEQSFPDFERYWHAQSRPFSPPGRSIAQLDDRQRERLRDHMRATLPAAPDGGITYSARAVAGKARKPI